MSAILRLTLPLIAYLCVGTVITALIGYGYLRKSGKLSDETMFRITALLHGIDLEALEKEGLKTVEDVPPEEPSFAEQQALVHAQTLRFDAKQKQLEDSLNDFNYQRKQVTEEQARYQQLQAQVENYLNDQRTKLANADLEAVRAQLEALVPKKQGKPLLKKYIEAGEIETVIKLLSSMKDRSRYELLRTFDQPEDIEMLYQIQQHMLNDNPAMEQINEQLEKLNQLNAQEK
jgi:hypothetical protein